MAPTSTLPDNPVYAFVPAYASPDKPQSIRLVFQDIPGYIPTALVALTLADAERLCDRLNSKLGLGRDAWMRLAARAMRDAGAESSGALH